MAEKREGMVLVKRHNDGAVRLYRAPAYEVDEGDFVTVEGCDEPCYGTVVASKDYVADDERAFWLKVMGITELKRVLTYAEPRLLYVDEEDEAEVEEDETV